MTITEFLLARIAEDEAIARAAATRVGAEEWRWYDHETDVELDWVVCVLASVYADHPDFDPAWRAD